MGFRSEEHSLQITVYKTLLMALPADAYVRSVDHAISAWRIVKGKKVPTVQAMQRKARGVIAGQPDMDVFYQGHCIGIELKTPRGALSDAQKAAHCDLKAAGVPVLVCRSLDEVLDGLRALGVPLGATSRIPPSRPRPVSRMNDPIPL